VDMMALDTVSSNRTQPDGLALQSGQFIALKQNAWGLQVLGAIPTPSGYNWTAMALHDGHAVVLEENGGGFELDMKSGQWGRRVRVPSNFRWHGLCALPNMQGWIALGRPMSGLGPPEFWQFSQAAFFDA